MSEGFVDLAGPKFVRRSGLEPYNLGRMTLRNILMWALRLEARQALVIAEDDEKRYGFLWASLLLRLDSGDRQMFSIPLDVLLAHLEALPSAFVVDLPEILDDRDREFEPTNDLALEQATWFRSAGAIRRLVQVEIEILKVSFTFSQPPGD